MERWFDMVFDLKRIPVKLVLVFWICAIMLLVLPESTLSYLKLNDFLMLYGKYIGITFIFCSALLFAAILTSIIRAIKNRIRKNKIEHSIMENLNRLDSFEKAILREFCLQNKNTISMPSNNSTVVGLEIKGIIYQASDLGFANSLGSFFPYSITGFAKDKLTNEIIDSPRDFTDIDSTRINDSRPNWVNISAF